MGLNIACFDIEATALNASFGRLLCACFKYQGDDNIVTYEAFTKKEEEKCVRAIRKEWDNVDIVVSWYGKMYDVRFLNAKAIRYDIRPFHGKMHLDLKFLHSHHNATAGHSLVAASQDLRTKNQKYDVPREAWQDATDGCHKSFNEIVKHCKYDVLVLEEVLDRMKGQITNITR